MLKIAIYGKGGIGKSTTAANVSAAMADRGCTVLQIGCDPKADSTGMLTGGRRIDTVLDTLRRGGETKLDELVIPGYKGVLCVEAGGPTPGIGCAGRGIITAFDTLDELNAYEIYRPDVVIYDVLGDVVCGGFAMPIRNGFANRVFVVTSGEKMSIYAAANIAAAVANFKGRNYAELSGIILNRRNVPDEMRLVTELADEIGAPITQALPRDEIVQHAEEQGKTVIEAFPDSPMADEYRALADKMLEVSCHEQTA
jgi:nitrogenase iron protein NifH